MNVEKVFDMLGRLWPALPLALVGAGLCAAAAYALWELRHRDEFVQVQATVTEVHATTSTQSSGGGHSWWVTAVCDYLWQGERFTGKEVSLTGGSVPSQSKMEALKAEHPPGSRLTLWIHPGRPGLAEVHMPSPTTVWVLAGVGAIFLAAAGGFYLSGSR